MWSVLTKPQYDPTIFSSKSSFVLLYMSRNLLCLDAMLFCLPASRSIIAIGRPSRRREAWVPALCSLEQSTNRELEKKAILSPSLLLSSLISTFQKSLRTTISKFIDHPPLDPSVDPNQVFAGNFAPVDELEPTNCEVVEGELPGCLNGQATYCSRHVKTYKYMLEKEAGFPIFPNMLVMCGHINLMRGFGLATTSLAFFSHKLLALLFASMTARPKVDKDTKQAFALQCNFRLASFEPNF
uniref:Uncharacterized protein n=1 Tax=Populus trichocarpa TaxID=3694 RepID=A0A2K1Z8A8_POPTR